MAIRKKLKSLLGGIGKREAGGANYLPQTASSPLSNPLPPPVAAAPAKPPAPAGPPAPGGELTLELYGRDSCGYSRRVKRQLDDLPKVNGLVVHRNTGSEPAARQELSASTGRDTVPCLKIGDYWLFESEDIIKWLKDHEKALSS